MYYVFIKKQLEDLIKKRTGKSVYYILLIMFMMFMICYVCL